MKQSYKTRARLKYLRRSYYKGEFSSWKKKSCILFLAHQPSFQPLTSVNQFNYVNLVMNSLYTQKKNWAARVWLCSKRLTKAKERPGGLEINLIKTSLLFFLPSKAYKKPFKFLSSSNNLKICQFSFFFISFSLNLSYGSLVSTSASQSLHPFEGKVWHLGNTLLQFIQGWM